jgi:hypothetical protein
MKYIIMICLLSLFFLKEASAQVSNADFVKSIGDFVQACNHRKVDQENSSFNTLNTYMTSQISYLNANVNTLMAKYSADTAKANADTRAANVFPNTKESAVLLQDAATQIQDSKLVTDAIKHSKFAASGDQTIYNNIQSLKGNLQFNENRIFNYLMQFAATLQ